MSQKSQFLRIKWLSTENVARNKTTFTVFADEDLNYHILEQNSNAVFNHIDIRNVVQYTYHRQDKTGNDVDAQNKGINQINFVRPSF